MNLSRRNIFKTLIGAAVATAAAPLLPVVQKVMPNRQLPKFLLPLVRKTMPALLASDIIGVQPMTGPVGHVFHLKIEHNKTRTNSFFMRVFTGRK